MNEMRIAVGMPTYADINPKVVFALARACIVAHKRGILISSIGGTEKELLCHARNRIIKACLESDATHLFFLDSDIVLPNDAIANLADANLDVITGIYFQKVPPHFPLIMAKNTFLAKKGKEKGLHSFAVDWPQDEIFPIDAGGLGCCLIKKEVFELIKSPWVAWTEDSGEDIGFFMRLRQAGINIYCHPRVVCGHINGSVIGIEDFKSNKIETKTQVEIKAGVYAEVLKNNENIRGQY